MARAAFSVWLRRLIVPFFVTEQEPAHREHDGLPQHHGDRV